MGEGHRLFVEQVVNDVRFMAAPNITAVHAFTTRFGGVSRGVYNSMNLGLNQGDDPASVSSNYAIICRTLSLQRGSFAGSRQVHGAHIRTVTRADCGKLSVIPTYEADGLLTGESGVTLIVFAADCVPILLHDPVRCVISAIHSGWRGTSRDIVGAAVRKMSHEFGCSPADIRAAIGPSISKCCYDTDSDVADVLKETLLSGAEYCITARGEKYMIDLKEANRLLLRKAGVYDIDISDECTSCLTDKYWSHRRISGRRGSQAALIAI